MMDLELDGSDRCRFCGGWCSARRMMGVPFQLVKSVTAAIGWFCPLTIEKFAPTEIITPNPNPIEQLNHRPNNERWEVA